jgi:acyl-coenzyme A synthetase/AMP-(fatty) acid ligase
MVFLFCIFNNGTRITTKKPFSPKSFGDIIRKLKVTNAIISSSEAIELSYYSDFKSTDYKSLKEVLYRGQKLPYKTRQFLNEHLPNGSFHTTYGFAEICNIAHNNDHTADVDENLIGFLRPNVQCKILNEFGEAVGTDQCGEITIKSEFIFAVS